MVTVTQAQAPLILTESLANHVDISANSGRVVGLTTVLLKIVAGTQYILLQRPQVQEDDGSISWTVTIDYKALNRDIKAGMIPVIPDGAIPLILPRRFESEFRALTAPISPRNIREEFTLTICYQLSKPEARGHQEYWWFTDEDGVTYQPRHFNWERFNSHVKEGKIVPFFV